MKYTVIIPKGPESGYVAQVPILKGCIFQGATREEVLANVKEAIEAYIEALLEDELPVPTEVGRDTYPQNSSTKLPLKLIYLKSVDHYLLASYSILQL
jgi:predicted RNase H-like HicB family nuclease